MRELPPSIERILASLGVNTNRLKWKLHYWEQDRAKRREAAANRSHGRRYVACRHCGELAVDGDKVCKCGRRLPSYFAYRISRALALDKPEFTMTTAAFLSVIALFFVWHIALYGPKALLAPSTRSLIDFGAFAGVFLEDGQYWRILTMALAHAGILHIGFNLLAISQMLPRFEEEIGSWRALLLITVTQIAAALAHVIFNPPNVPTVGASGVAFGLIGFGLAYAHRHGDRAMRGFFIHWFIYGTVFSIAFRFNNAAHTGGFLAGLPLGYWMAGRGPRGGVLTITQALGVVCLALWLAAAACLALSVIGSEREEAALRTPPNIAARDQASLKEIRTWRYSRDSRARWL